MPLLSCKIVHNPHLPSCGCPGSGPLQFFPSAELESPKVTGQNISSATWGLGCSPQFGVKRTCSYAVECEEMAGYVSSTFGLLSLPLSLCLFISPPRLKRTCFSLPLPDCQTHYWALKVKKERSLGEEQEGREKRGKRVSPLGLSQGGIAPHVERNK